MLRAILFIGLIGCSGSQANEKRGDVFCESYENSFMGQCRQHCDATSEGTPEEVGKKCSDTCTADLKDDDTFVESCAARAKSL